MCRLAGAPGQRLGSAWMPAIMGLVSEPRGWSRSMNRSRDLPPALTTLLDPVLPNQGTTCSSQSPASVLPLQPSGWPPQLSRGSHHALQHHLGLALGHPCLYDHQVSAVSCSVPWGVCGGVTSQAYSGPERACPLN